MTENEEAIWRLLAPHHCEECEKHFREMMKHQPQPKIRKATKKDLERFGISNSLIKTVINIKKDLKEERKSIKMTKKNRARFAIGVPSSKVNWQ